MAQGSLTRGIGDKQPWERARLASLSASSTSPTCWARFSLSAWSWATGTRSWRRSWRGCARTPRPRAVATRTRRVRGPGVDQHPQAPVSPAEEREFEKDDYGSLDIPDDGGEAGFEFHYATLFVSAFPRAPVFACVNNFIEIRVDGWKMCQNNSWRPWPRLPPRTSGPGSRCSRSSRFSGRSRTPS